MAERKIIDARGTYCPGPLMDLIAGMKQATIGDEFEALSTDAGSASDVSEWINKVGHAMVSTMQEGDVWQIVARKTK